MIYIIIPDKTKIEYIQGRIDALNWSYYSKNGFILVRNDLSDARQVLDALTGSDKLANTVIFKLEDTANHYYWGYSSEDMWNWLRDNSSNPHTSWRS